MDIMESMSQSGILLKIIRQSSGVYICYSDGVRQIRPRLVCTSEDESRVEEDIWEEDRDLFPESDSQDLFNSVSAAKKPRLDEEDKDQLLFKYKTPVIAFADHQGQLFSLHKKSSTHVYVEICQISTWTCANSCLVKIPLSKVSRTEGEYWMHVLPISHVVPELTDLMSSQGLDLSHILLVKIPFQRLFVVPIAYGGNVETLLQVPEKLDVSSKVDVFVKLYHYRDVEHSLHEDIIDRILRSAQISLENSHNFIAREDIKEVIPFQDGFLMLLRDGKLWEYYKIGNTVRRTLIPVQLVAMIHFSWDGSGVVLTQTYDQYLMKLPFNESWDIADTSWTDLKLIQEALENVEELERLNQIRMTQETLLKQIKVGASLKEHEDLGQMFSTQISIHPLKVFDLDNGFRSSIKFLNESTFDLMGKFWSLHIAFTTKDSSLSCCHTIELPQELKHGSSFSAQIDVPEEIRRLPHLPIEVRGDLEFNSKFNQKSSILFKRVFKVQLNTVHFLSVVSDSTDDLIFNPSNQNSCEELVRDWTMSKYPSLSLNVLKKQTRLSTIHVEMTSEMLQNFKDMSLFRAILDGSRSVYNLILFHHGLTLSVTDKKWTISGTDGNVLEKVYLDLCHFKRTFALQCNEGKVEVPKAMATKAFELHYELGLLDQDDPTDENLAILNQCMEAFKVDIGAKLC